VSVANSSVIPPATRTARSRSFFFAKYGITPDPFGTALQDFGPGGGDWGAMN
jgi:peptide/nickel transport system substrate-binding protein